MLNFIEVYENLSKRNVQKNSLCKVQPQIHYIVLPHKYTPSHSESVRLNPVSRIDHYRKYHNKPYGSLFVTLTFCTRIVFSVSWGHFNSQEKLKTMLTQNFGGDIGIIVSLPADVLWGSFVTHSFRHCVTNEPQRTSAGRLHYSMLWYFLLWSIRACLHE